MKRNTVATIHVIQGADKGRILELREGENVIGRVDCSVTLADGTVSRRHARLLPSNGKWVLEDLGSANGTFLNGSKLARAAEVKGGDQIRCGTTLLVFSGGAKDVVSSVDIDEHGRLVDAAVVATVPSSDDSVIIPTPEAGAKAIDALRILYELISETSSVFNVDELMERTLDKVFQVVRADRGYIMLADERGELQLKAARVLGESPSGDIPISRTIINEVMRNQVGILSTNAMQDKRFSKGKSVQDFGIRSALCVPIKGREKVLGVIHVDCSISDHTYTTEQLRLMTAIGNQTGLGAESVRLYEAAVQSEHLAAMGEAVAYLSHHIKNILQALGAGADVVEMGLKAGDVGKAAAAWPIVQRNLDRIHQLILNMLAFSKKREPLLEKINVNAVLTECIELATPAADRRGVAILTDLEDMPPIPAEAQGLHQAFLNLLNNAVEAVEDNAGVVTVTSRFDPEARAAVLRVIDNGRGIPAEQVQRIFRPFYSSKGYGGTGLGLAVARKVAEEHGGRIEVQSAVGQGTTFTVTLPAGNGADAGDTDTPATA